MPCLLHCSAESQDSCCSHQCPLPVQILGTPSTLLQLEEMPSDCHTADKTACNPQTTASHLAWSSTALVMLQILGALPPFSFARASLTMSREGSHSSAGKSTSAICNPVPRCCQLRRFTVYIMCYLEYSAQQVLFPPRPDMSQLFAVWTALILEGSSKGGSDQSFLRAW